MITIKENEPLAAHTTIGLGGPARYWAEARSLDELRAALAWARERSLRVHVLGGGSNTLFADAGFAGLVLHIALRGLTFADAGDAVLVTAAGGEPWDALVAATVAHGLQGLEGLSGIPGTVGSAPVQNIGAYGQEVADTLVSLRALDRSSGEEVIFPAAECGFGYRQSRFKGADRGRYLITAVTFRLRRGQVAEVRYAELKQALEPQAPPWTPAEVRAAVLSLRRRKSMLVDPADPHARSLGSFFLNPVVSPEHCDQLQRRYPGLPAYPVPEGCKLSAAWLIEQAGFSRGTRRGGVGLSPHHALALVNYGGTTAELLAFAEEIQAGVQALFGVHLEMEPVLVMP